jgi:hypothetical protein
MQKVRGFESPDLHRRSVAGSHLGDRPFFMAAGSKVQQRLFRLVLVVGTLNSDYTTRVQVPELAKWECLARATAAEGEIEALMARLAAERPGQPKTSRC